jgi:hypothetical protein
VKRVLIESPLRADTPKGYERNRVYARRAMRDCLLRGEAPFASHLLYDQPGILDDANAGERRLGMEAGFAWGMKAELAAVYVDYGVSGGMEEGIKRHKTLGIEVVTRTIGVNP